MNVTLLSYTPDALDLLLFTKQTRLQMSPVTLDTIKGWSMRQKMSELAYMLTTIQSSWEFVDYVFAIENVTRAFTHQLVRHRVGVSFAQQSQRSVDMTNFGYETGPSIANSPIASAIYESGMQSIDSAYRDLLARGVDEQDARGILPTNIHTNIIMKANLRALHEMGLKRLCVKAQGEFQDVFRQIRQAVLEVHPWADMFIRVHCAFHGTCLFPSLPNEQCPVKDIVYDPRRQTAYDGGEPGSLIQIQRRWEEERGTVQPKPARSP